MQLINKPVLFLLAILALNSCKKNNSENTVFQVEKNNTSTEKVHPGKSLLEIKCNICHSPSASHDEGRIGPPMIAVKLHYLEDTTTKEEFISAIWNFVNKPSEENAKMRGAIRRFGLMPYQPFNKEEIEKIAEYLYDYEIEEPAWFEEHWKSRGKGLHRKRGKQSAVIEKTGPKEKGLHFALETKKVLGKNLMGTLQKKGTLEALQFCNEKAYPLTDSMATRFKAAIKRVSDKPRNPANKANEKEAEIIEHYKKVIAKNESIEPIIESDNNQHIFYYPITTNSMCLQCHGKPGEQIKPSLLKSLKELYPDDEAIGYDTNEVRGIWSISFKSAL
jgi:mono/diheme cytochrome c family protein